MLTAVFLFGTVRAQGPDTPVSSGQAGNGSLQERVTERKAARQIQLDQAGMQNIQAKCEAAQTRLQHLSDRLSGVGSRKQRVYDNLMERLNGLSPKLAAAGLDASDYDQTIQELQVKVDALYSTSDDLKLAVSDMADMDCANDPVGFQATLETARTTRTEAAQSAQEVQDYLKNTVLPSLTDLRQQLAPEETENGQ